MSHTYFYTPESASGSGAEVPLWRPPTGLEGARFPCWFRYRAVTKSRALNRGFST